MIVSKRKRYTVSSRPTAAPRHGQQMMYKCTVWTAESWFLFRTWFCHDVHPRFKGMSVTFRRSARRHWRKREKGCNFRCTFRENGAELVSTFNLNFPRPNTLLLLKWVVCRKTGSLVALFRNNKVIFLPLQEINVPERNFHDCSEELPVDAGCLLECFNLQRVSKSHSWASSEARENYSF